jgi:hypothetical protein
MKFMKEWHVNVMLEKKIVFSKRFFKVEEARACEAQKREEYADQLSNKTAVVSREYY